MARKKHLINVHTSTGTTAPTGASLYLGEIAVQHTQDDPALWIKVGSAETSTEYEKFIGLTEITNIFNMSQILGSGYTYSGLPYVNSATTIADAYSALTKELIDDELVTAAALNDLNNRIPEPVDLEPLSASVVTNKTNIETISAWVEDNEIVTAAALNDLNDRIIELSGSTGDNTEMIEYIQENEEVVAAALNNLNHRVGTVETHMTGDYIPITGYILACGTTEEELTLRETDTVNEALGKLQKQSLDNEEAIAAGLNDLNQRVSENAAAIARNTGVTALSGAVRSLSAATYNIIGQIGNGLNRLTSATQNLSSATESLSASVMSISAKTSGILTVNVNGEEQGKYSPSANTTLDLEVIQEVTGADVLLTGYELASGTTEEELAILASDTVNEAFGKIQKQNYDNEAVIAGALNDLDEQIQILSGLVADISGNTGGGGTDTATTEAGHYAPTTTASTIGTTASTTNFIKGINVDSKNHVISVATGAVITAETQLSTATTGTGNVMTDITVNNHQITKNFGMTIPAWATASTKPSYTAAEVGVPAWATASTKPSYTASEVGALPTGTTLDNIADGTTRKLSNYATLADFTAHTGNSTVHVTSSEKSAWNGKQDAISDLSTIRDNASSGASAFTGVTALSGATIGINNTLTAHTGNGDIHVTAANKNTWDGKQDAISDLATIRNNALSGASAYTRVNSLSAATTAHTANTTVHVTAANKTAWTNGANSGASAYTAVTALSAVTTAHTANSAIHVPAASSANNDKIPIIRNGVWTLEYPATIYSGQNAPDNTQGRDGDIYLQTS